MNWKFFLVGLLLLIPNFFTSSFAKIEESYVRELQENVGRISALRSGNKASPKVNVELFRKLSNAMLDLKFESLGSTFDYIKLDFVKEIIKFAKYMWARYDYATVLLEAINANNLNEINALTNNLKASHVSTNVTSERLERLHNQLVFYYGQTESWNIPMCKLRRSRQQVIHDFYETVILTDLMGTIILSVFDQVTTNNAHRESNAQFQKFFQRQAISYEKTKRAITQASRALYACDPAENPRGNAFANLDIYESKLRRFDKTPLLCQGKEARASPCCKYQFEQHPCNGIMVKCNNNILFCNAPNDDLPTVTLANHVYDSKSKSNVVSKVCQSSQSGTNHCFSDACYCIKDDKNADRYFRLGEVTSDSDDNKVVTGVKLHKENNFYYIQIQEGKLGPNGTIVGAPKWKEINNKIEGIDSYAKAHPSFKLGDETDDFYTVYRTKNTIYLDDITPPRKSSKKRLAVTGLRFVQEDRVLKLEIEMKPYDYATGLMRGRNEWYASNVPAKSRHEHTLEDKIEPIYYDQQYEISTPGSFVKFQGTSMKKSLELSTIPFIDLQEIVTNPPSPVSGAGIFVKGTKGSGGYLSLKLITQDVTSDF